VENRDIFISHLRSTPPLGGPRRNITVAFGTKKLEWWIYQMVKKVWEYVYSFWHSTRTWWKSLLTTLTFMILRIAFTGWSAFCSYNSLYVLSVLQSVLKKVFSEKKFKVLCPCVASRSFQFKPNPAKMDWVQITTAILQVCSWYLYSAISHCFCSWTTAEILRPDLCHICILYYVILCIVQSLLTVPVLCALDVRLIWISFIICYISLFNIMIHELSNK